MLTNEQLAHLKTLSANGTAAPWSFELLQKYYRVGNDEYPYLIERIWSATDAELIATARNMLPVLVAEVQRLTTHNRIMQVALAQFSDGVNWSTAPSVRYVQSGEWPSSVDHPVYIWHVATNPQQLAERALVGDGEVSTTNES